MNYVIIGNSTAAIGAVEGIREIDQQGTIHVISHETYPAYSRPLISYYLAGKAADQDMYYRNPGFYEQARVTVHLGKIVSGIDIENRTVALGPDGSKLVYDRLLIATGGKPNCPALFAKPYGNLYFFHSWDDVKKIQQSLQANRIVRAVVVGGGLIGLKAAESLYLKGLNVTVVEAGSHLLNSILDQTGGDILAGYLQQKGLQIYTDTQVTEVNGWPDITHLTLQEGEVLEADLVILAAGVRPNIEWLNSLDLKTDQGIVVDDHLRSSAQYIYAAGDVAQALDKLTNQQRVMPILPNASIQGRLAGMNMAGKAVPYPGGLAFNSIPLCGMNIATAGLSNINDTKHEILAVQRGDNYRRFVLADNRLKGFIMMGNINRCGILKMAIDQQMDLSKSKPRLLEDDFGLADLHLMTT